MKKHFSLALFSLHPGPHFVRFFAGKLMFALTLASTAAVQNTSAAQPNVLVVMVDDMGYSDIGCYGGEIRTPTLDALAANGVRLARFYNAAQCCPSRASLLSGLYRIRRASET